MRDLRGFGAAEAFDLFAATFAPFFDAGGLVVLALRGLAFFAFVTGGAAAKAGAVSAGAALALTGYWRCG